MEMTKILFLHNTVMPYRLPFFIEITKIYKIKFIFTRMEVCKNIYGINSIDINNIDYNILPSKNRFFLYIKELLTNDHDIFIDSLEYMAPFTFIITKLRKKSIIFWSEEWEWMQEIKLWQKVILAVKKFIARNSDAVLVPGIKHKQFFIKLNIEPEKIFIMPNVSNYSLFKKNYVSAASDIRKKYDIRNHKVILFVGRLVERKGLKYLIHAFIKLRKEQRDLLLLVVGEGPEKNKLENIVNDNKSTDSVIWAGYVKNEDLPAYYVMSNVCVVPSITCGIGDPWVFVLNEAMHFGKPVVATEAVGAAYDLIKDGENGYIVPEKDSDALYKAIKSILSSCEKEKKMGQMSKRIIEEGFQYKNMISGFMSAINYVSLKGGNKS